MSKSIFELVDELPTSNLTVSMLKALDFVAPGTGMPVGATVR